MLLSSTVLKCAIAVGECTVVVYTKSPLRRSFSSASVRCAFGSGCSIAPGRSGSCCNQPLLHPGACAPCAHSCQKTGSFACGSGASTTQAFRTIRRERSAARDAPWQQLLQWSIGYTHRGSPSLHPDRPRRHRAHDVCVSPARSRALEAPPWHRSSRNASTAYGSCPPAHQSSAQTRWSPLGCMGKRFPRTCYLALWDSFGMRLGGA